MNENKDAEVDERFITGKNAAVRKASEGHNFITISNTHHISGESGPLDGLRVAPTEGWRG